MSKRDARIEGEKGLPPQAVSRAVHEYLAVLGDAPLRLLGGERDRPKFISPADAVARFLCHPRTTDRSENAIPVDVEPITAGGSSLCQTHFALPLSRLLAHSAYVSADMLSWLVDEHGIDPHVTILDKSAKNGTFARYDDFHPLTLPHRMTLGATALGFNHSWRRA